MTRKTDFHQLALDAGYLVREYSPGDGVTRYRFFVLAELENPEAQSYFGPANGAYTALGIREAETFLEGLHAARYLGG